MNAPNGPARWPLAGAQRPLANALVGGAALLAALAAVQRYTHLLPGAAQHFELPRERCYGVARAGQNDCGTSVHACAAQATRDAAEAEWLSLPSGTCRKLAGGLLLR